jgi:hypothetical protein
LARATAARRFSAASLRRLRLSKKPPRDVVDQVASRTRGCPRLADLDAVDPTSGRISQERLIQHRTHHAIHHKLIWVPLEGPREVSEETDVAGAEVSDSLPAPNEPGVNFCFVDRDDAEVDPFVRQWVWCVLDD